MWLDTPGFGAPCSDELLAGAMEFENKQSVSCLLSKNIVHTTFLHVSDGTRTFCYAETDMNFTKMNVDLSFWFIFAHEYDTRLCRNGKTLL